MPASASASMRDSCHWTWGSLDNTNKRASPQLPTQLFYVTDPQNGEKEFKPIVEDVNSLYVEIKKRRFSKVKSLAERCTANKYSAWLKFLLS